MSLKEHIIGIYRKDNQLQVMMSESPFFKDRGISNLEFECKVIPIEWVKGPVPWCLTDRKVQIDNEVVDRLNKGYIAITKQNIERD